jgi:ribonucleoside-diphosphate reductase alpha chain
MSNTETANVAASEKWYENSLSQTLLDKKYYHEGEDFDAFVDRVTGIFSPELAPKFRQCLLNGEFFPAGRSLYGAGSKGKFRGFHEQLLHPPLPRGQH